MSSAFVPLIGPIPGGMEMVVILLIAVLLFGANKIPKLARSSGQAIGEFQKGREEVEQELQDIQESDVEAEAERTETFEDEETFETESETETATETDLDTDEA